MVTGVPDGADDEAEDEGEEVGGGFTELADVGEGAELAAPGRHSGRSSVYVVRDHHFQSTHESSRCLRKCKHFQ